MDFITEQHPNKTRQHTAFTYLSGNRRNLFRIKLYGPTLGSSFIPPYQDKLLRQKHY
jgi:hypothetical protein